MRTEAAALQYEDFDILYEDDFEITDKSPEDGVLLSPEDAFVDSINQTGRISLSRMSRRSGRTAQQLIDSLEGRVMWKDPERFDPADPEEGWLTREQYLQGNVFRLLAAARKADAGSGLYQKNIDLLTANLPGKIAGEDITITLGATWVPAKVYRGFAGFILNSFGNPPEVEYDSYFGKWRTTGGSYAPVFMNAIFGTERMDAKRILEHTMNAAPIRVFDQVRDRQTGKKRSVLNPQETQAARDKQALIIAEFRNYLQRRPEIMEELQEIYSDKYGYRVVRYDGSFLKLPGLNPDVKLYRHQKDVVARIVLSGQNVLISHEVGSGKTYAFEIGVYECLRMQLAKKALIVVPNAVFEATVETFHHLYPDFPVTAISPAKFRKAVREEALRELETSRSGVFILSFSSFDMLKLSKSWHLKALDDELLRCKEEIVRMKDDHAACERLQNELERLTEKRRDYEETAVEEPEDCFDRLGFDLLVVDECHNYKNISLHTSVEGVVGLNSKGSVKADALLEKCDYLTGHGGRLIFATGTPLTNSLADLYVLQRYLQPEQLRLLSIGRFSEWVNTFCMQKQEFEIDVTSASYRFRTRFDRFHNLPELMALFGNVCDFSRVDEAELSLPDFEGHTDVKVPRSKAQEIYISDIVERTELIRNPYQKPGRKSIENDNYLKITLDGRKCALDARLVRDGLLQGTDSRLRRSARKVEKLLADAGNCGKAAAAAGKITEIYTQYPGMSQIVFCDISVPKPGCFNVYEALRDLLIENGIPAEEIGLLHGGISRKIREKMLRDLDEGRLRVMIGSTMLLGQGVNVQTHLVAVHHLDVPWKPAEMVQREGRALRQGNENREIFIFRYITEGSFDAYSWQILESKQRFIASFLSGTIDQTDRTEGDIGDLVLDYAEIKALAIGNPLIRDRVETANLLARERTKAAGRREELRHFQEIVRKAPEETERVRRQIEAVRADEVCFSNHRNAFTAKRRLEIGEKILSAIAANRGRTWERHCTWYRGFAVAIPALADGEKPYVLLRRNDVISYHVKMDDAKPAGVTTRLDNVLLNLGRRCEELRAKAVSIGQSAKAAGKEIAKGNPCEKTVRSLAAKLDRIDAQLQES